MPDEPMTLIEQLRNPAWVHGDHGFESPQLEIDMTRACMDHAAATIEGLEAQVCGLKQLSAAQSKITNECEATISRLTADLDVFMTSNASLTTECLELRAERDGLRKALEFYADQRRHRGANQRLEPGEVDPWNPEAAYIHDVSRDGGSIARRALMTYPLPDAVAEGER